MSLKEIAKQLEQRTAEIKEFRRKKLLEKYVPGEKVEYVYLHSLNRRSKTWRREPGRVVKDGTERVKVHLDRNKRAYWYDKLDIRRVQ